MDDDRMAREPLHDAQQNHFAKSAGNTDAGGASEADAYNPTKMSSSSGEKVEKIGTAGESKVTESPVEKKPKIWKKIWDALGLNPGLLLMMFK
jgi:hypothetical protein